MTTFYIQTYGCSHNQADSEQMAGLLKDAQFEPAVSLPEADIVIFNTCTVKGPTASSFYTALENFQKEFPYKIVIIAGCIPQTEPEKLKKLPLVGTRQIHHIVEIVEEALGNNHLKLLETKEMPPLNLPSLRKNPFIEIIPLSRGCLSACTFCKTKQARGNLQSYPINEIVERAQKAVQEGVREIWLTSQDNFCYGFDIGTNLAQLLKKVLEIPGKFKVRVGMGSYHHLLKYKDELIPLFNHENMFRFIHLPIQTGSDKVLKQMRRESSVAEFTSLVQEFRVRVPHITIATDIIVGYPTETEEDFWATLNFVRHTNPDVINISRFWARPGTVAVKLEELPLEVVQKRTKILTDIFHNTAKMQNEKWIGWEGEVIIDEKGGVVVGKNRNIIIGENNNVAGEDRDVAIDDNNTSQQWIGKNFAYKQVIVEDTGQGMKLGIKSAIKLGDIIRVKIERAGTFDIRGKRV